MSIGLGPADPSWGCLDEDSGWEECEESSCGDLTGGDTWCLIESEWSWVFVPGMGGFEVEGSWIDGWAYREL